MADPYQIPIPPSFVAVHADERGRLRLPLAAFRDRYELCEDLAQALVERARSLHADAGVDERSVLERVAQGLADPAAGLNEAEGRWVRRRLAELLGWAGAAG